jgi:3-isopropylmalate/(R)-2-methylmalate dehydratase small subunit
MATPFTKLTSLPMPLIRNNVDTDQIIPSREMRGTGKTGLADGLFAGWRYSSNSSRQINPDFVMNNPKYEASQIILGGENFGCGSSREHAVWALVEYGFLAIIAPSFAPIFASNCKRNGLLPVILDPKLINQIASEDALVTIDLETQGVFVEGGQTWFFPIEAEDKTMLLEGSDPIDLSLKLASDIAAWQAADKIARPWIYLGVKS